MPEAFGKPFLAITDQVSLLESRGLATDSSTARVLTSEEFFAFLEDFIALLDKVSNKADGIGHVLQAVGFSELMGEIQRRAVQ